MDEQDLQNLDLASEPITPDDVVVIVKDYLQSSAFTDRKLTDYPTDDFAVVNRQFVTLSSNLGARPVSSVAVVGQFFFDTSNNTPIWYTTAGWRNSVGSITAQNN